MVDVSTSLRGPWWSTGMTRSGRHDEGMARRARTRAPVTGGDWGADEVAEGGRGLGGVAWGMSPLRCGVGAARVPAPVDMTRKVRDGGVGVEGMTSGEWRT